MPCRIELFQEAVAGFKAFGVPLVSLKNGLAAPSGYSDDIGAYYFVQKIAGLTGFQVGQCVDAFYFGMIAIALLAGGLGVMRLYPEWRHRLVFFCYMALSALISLKIGDVYISQAALVLALLPWGLFLFFRDEPCRAPGPSPVSLSIFTLAAGLLCGVGHHIRGHAGTGVILFVGLSILLSRGLPRRSKILGAGLMILGFLVPFFFFGHLLAQRDAFIARQNPGAEKVLQRHPFWHTIYIGLGFLANDHVKGRLDHNAMERVQEIAPGTEYISRKYEDILRGEVLRLVRSHPHFLLRTLAAKTGIILLYLVLAANLGLLFHFLAPFDWRLQIPFLAALSFNSIFGLLATPYGGYLLGMIVTAALYGAFGVNGFLMKSLSGRQN